MELPHADDVARGYRSYLCPGCLAVIPYWRWPAYRHGCNRRSGPYRFRRSARPRRPGYGR